MAEFVNKVAESGLITIDLENWYPKGEIAVLDLKDYLFMGMIVKEKEFRDSLKNTDWETYRNKMVSVICSADAIIPSWALIYSQFVKSWPLLPLKKCENRFFFEIFNQLTPWITRTSVLLSRVVGIPPLEISHI
jgi:hypothetical protein